jgi:hypothetical protein
MVTLNAPDGSVVITVPDTSPAILNVPATDELVVPVAGPTGGAGPAGPPDHRGLWGTSTKTCLTSC